MGIFNFRQRLTPLAPPLELGPKFAVDIDDALLYGMYPAPTTVLAPRVSRREAMSVPAVKRARDLIAGSLGSLPLNLVNPDNEVQDWSLFDQPEEDVPRSVTLTQTFEDILFEQVSWWRVTHVGWHGKPVSVVRLDPRSVTVLQDSRVYETVQGNQGTVQRWIPDEQLIRFDGPNDPLLVAGARAIRSAMALDAAAMRHADGAPPIDYFTPVEGADPADDDDISAMLSAWQSARQARSTGYVPAALKYNISGYNPEQLQLQDARTHAVTEIARLAGLSPEYLGVSTTSRTYQNAQDERRFLMDFTLRGYMTAFQDRLSMNDVTPRGYRANLNTTDFLGTDDKTRMEIAVAGVTGKVLLPEEGRAFFNPLLPMDIELPEAAPAPAPAEAPAEEPVEEQSDAL